MIEGKFEPANDMDWHYICKAQDNWAPLPLSYVPILSGEEAQDKWLMSFQ